MLPYRARSPTRGEPLRLYQILRVGASALAGPEQFLTLAQAQIVRRLNRYTTGSEGAQFSAAEKPADHTSH